MSNQQATCPVTDRMSSRTCVILPLRVRNPSTQFKKLLRIERRTLWNSWCVIERREVIQLGISVNRCKQGASESHRLPRVSGLLLWIICRVKRIYVLRRENNSVFLQVRQLSKGAPAAQSLAPLPEQRPSILRRSLSDSWSARGLE